MRKYIFAAMSSACVAGASLADPAVYATPQDAFDALTAAVQARDQAAFAVIMGDEGVDLVVSDSPVENRVARELFLALVADGYRFQRAQDAVILVLGSDDWPFPIPIAKRDGGWQFDVETGREELRDREIGLNELNVMDLMRAYVDLQQQFRLTDHDGDGVMEFASSIISSAEDRTGLFWPGGGLVGQALARASVAGWSDGEEDFEPEPFMGYYFTILHAQGDAAPGGAYGYFVGDNLVGGHAMLAVPAEYGETGVHSFLIGENGVLFEADLGEATLDKADAIAAYDPGDGWEPLD